MSTAYLLILGDREAIAWVLREQRMAFPATPRAEVAALAPGDRLFLYSTRGAWHNPPRDRGRVFGTAEVESPVRALDEPLEIAGRTFHSGCTLSVRSLAPYPQGVELQPLVKKLAAFPKPDAWPIHLRRALLRLPPADARLLDRELGPLTTSWAAAQVTYPSAQP